MSASVFPARAGMSLARLTKEPVTIGVPRASGDEPNPEGSGEGFLACSPCERG